MARWKLTVRSGATVTRRGFDDLDNALAAAKDSADEILEEPPLDQVKAFRDYGPAQRTKARIEIAGRGLLRPPTAGLDIRGDNSMVGFSGMVRRRQMRADGLRGILAGIREALLGA